MSSGEDKKNNNKNISNKYISKVLNFPIKSGYSVLFKIVLFFFNLAVVQTLIAVIVPGSLW